MPKMVQIWSKLKKQKPMHLMLGVILTIFGLIFAYKAFGVFMMNKYMKAAALNARATVSAEILGYQKWQPKLHVSGSLRAVQGVDVTTEVAGLVRRIAFTSGHEVKQGDLLVQLNIDADESQLKSLKALADLAEVNYLRDKEQYAVKTISKSTLDSSFADFKSKKAQADAQMNMLEKKIIRAPFTGKLGISAVNEGQYVDTGQKIVTLQALDPILVDFFIPQHELARVHLNQTIELKTNKKSDKPSIGKITAIDPKIDLNTRNAHIQATISNPNHLLLPGMFVSVDILTGAEVSYLTLPQTAISFNPYGDIVFVITEEGKDEKDKPILVANQRFVTLGETRGDQVAVLTGIKAGDSVVTSGQLKLKNGSRVVINNSILPANNPSPVVIDE